MLCTHDAPAAQRNLAASSPHLPSPSGDSPRASNTWSAKHRTRARPPPVAAAASAEGEGAGSEAAVKADGSAGDAPPVSLSPSSIGVISPYNAQVKYLRKLLAEALGPEVGHRIEVNSVDGFQGREKEVIIISAHYDHIGVTAGGEIYNGADDNGSGTTGLLAIAEALTVYGQAMRLDPESNDARSLYNTLAESMHIATAE